MTSTPPGSRVRRLSVLVSGHVQGVGFRWWARRCARELGLVGYAENLPDGRVRVVAEGPETSLRDLLVALNSGMTPGRVTAAAAEYADPSGDMLGFSVI